MNGGTAGRVDGTGASSGTWAARAAASGSHGRGGGSSPVLPPRSAAAPREAIINQLVTFLPTSQGVDVPSPGVTTASVTSFDSEFPPLPGRRAAEHTAERRRSLETLAPALGIRAAAAPAGAAVSEPLGVEAAQVAGPSSTVVPQVPHFGRQAPAGGSGRTPFVTGAGSAYSALSHGALSAPSRLSLPVTPPPRRPASLNDKGPYDGHPVAYGSVPVASSGSAPPPRHDVSSPVAVSMLTQADLTPRAQPGLPPTSQDRTSAQFVSRAPAFVREGLQTVVGPSLQSRLEALGATRVLPGAIAAAFGAAPNDLSSTLVPGQALPAKRRPTPTKRAKNSTSRKAAKKANCATPAASATIVSAALGL